MIARSESLGHNCEYGFWQRHQGFEASSLFRWAITPIEALLRFLDGPAAPYEDLEHLRPHSPGMVMDTESGFKFHSRLVERDNNGSLRLLADREQREAIFGEEKAKTDHLFDKFLTRIRSTPTLYVVKRNEGLATPDVVRLWEFLSGYNPAHKLLWAAAGVSPDVEEIHPRLHRGGVERFAPYAQADNYAPGAWTALLRQLAQRPDFKAMDEVR